MMKIYIFPLLALAALVGLCQGRIHCSLVRPRCYNNGRCNPNTTRCECIPSYFGEQCEFRNECHRRCTDNQICVKVRGTKRTRCSEIPCIQYADLAIILDCSGSISKANFLIMLKAMERLIKQFTIGPRNVQVAVFPFNDRIGRVIYLNDHNNKASLIRSLRKYANSHTGGGTRTDKALKFLRQRIFVAAKGDRWAAPDIGIILTDGRSNYYKKTIYQAALLKTTSTFMISVGIGNNVNKKELRIISTNNTVFMTNFKALPGMVGTLLNATCDYTKLPCYNNPCRNGGTCHPFLTTYICLCKHPWAGVNCQIRCSITGDIMIVIDESGSVPRSKFDQIIDSAMYLVKNFDMANGKVRVGILMYSTRVYIDYDLDAFNNKLDLLFVMDLLRFEYKGGLTNTHLALKQLADHCFRHEYGDRLKYPNYAVIFTDGKSRRPWLTKVYANALHNSGVSIYAIGVGYRVNKREIYYIASVPKRHHFIFTTFERLQWAIRVVLARMCRDLKPWNKCKRCDPKRCDCDPGMICCGGCCIDRVTLLG